MNLASTKFSHLTAWSLMIGGLLAYVTGGLLMSVTGGDPQAALDGVTMLSLSQSAQGLFRWAMLVDLFGFYLPILVFGGYFWRNFCEDADVFGEAAILAMMLYVTVGIAGAAIQQAVIYPLSSSYAAGDAAAATVWTTIAHAAQSGLWWCEGPAVLLWSSVVGSRLEKAGWKGSLLLRVAGWFCGLFFLSGFFPSLNILTVACGTVVASMLPLWMIVFGWQLRRCSKLDNDMVA